MKIKKMFLMFLAVVMIVVTVPVVGVTAETGNTPVIGSKPSNTGTAGFFLKKVSSDENSVVAELYFRNKGKFQVSSFAVSVIYSDNLILEDVQTNDMDGLYSFSPSYDSNPYDIIRLTLSALHEGDSKIATLTFSVSDPTVAYIDVVINENAGGVVDLNDNTIPVESFYLFGLELTSKDFKGEENIEDKDTTGFFVEKVSSDEDSVVADLYIRNKAGYSISGISISVSYTNNLILDNVQAGNIGGMFVFSQSYSDNPYDIVWVNLNSLPEGDSKIATLTFSVSEPIVSYIDVAINEEVGGIVDINDSVIPSESFSLFGLELVKKDFADEEEFYSYESTDTGAAITYVDSTVTGDVVIPETLGDVAVTFISADAFSHCEDITSITIPASVTEIEEGAFEGMEDLTLRGTSRSAAEVYAVHNGITYERNDGIIAGDVDGDKGFNIIDATTALKLIAKWNGINASETAADVNMDGVVNTVDVLDMLKYIAKWDGIYLF